MSLLNKVTILTPTHSFKIETSGKFQGYVNAVPSAPSTRLVEKGFRSIYRHTSLKGCRHILGLDHKGQPIDEAYFHNLKALEGAMNEQGSSYPNLEVFSSFCGTTDPKITATKLFTTLRSKVETEYFLMWEHDWEFTVGIDFEKIIAAMDKYEFINYIRFNSSKNQKGGIHYHLEPEDRVSEISLMKTPSWSGNPHLCRTSTWKHWWSKLVYPTPYCYVEQSIYESLDFSIGKMGWDAAKESWGLYLYGGDGEGPYVKHTDGNSYLG